MIVLACVAKPVPPRNKVQPKDIKQAVRRAHEACSGSEKTLACRVMWDEVSDLTHAFARQQEQEKDEELENRLYDL
jgi:hypothetical protein